MHTIIVAFHGTLDMASIRRASDLVQSAPVTEPVLLDFSQVREMADALFVSFITHLHQMGQHDLHVRGLRQHHHTLLRYIGLPAAAGRLSASAG